MGSGLESRLPQPSLDRPEGACFRQAAGLSGRRLVLCRHLLPVSGSRRGYARLANPLARFPNRAGGAVAAQVLAIDYPYAFSESSTAAAPRLPPLRTQANSGASFLIIKRIDNVYTLNYPVNEMDVNYTFQQVLFQWDRWKAEANLWKYKISFESACEVFFDPFVILIDAGVIDGERRDAVIGYTGDWRVLFVVQLVMEDSIRLISARPADKSERE